MDHGAGKIRREQIDGAEPGDCPTPASDHRLAAALPAFRETGLRFPQGKGRRFCGRVFLARPPAKVPCAEGPPVVLDEEDCPQGEHNCGGVRAVT